MSDADIADADALPRMPLDARMILHVGCGAGGLGGEYRRRNPAATILGIAADAAEAEQARRRLDRVYVADLDADPTPFAGDVGQGGFDCIVFGDTLERVRDPWNLLRRQIGFLAPDGVVLLSVGNLEHWRFAERLLRGTFVYEDRGPFDARHVRWFGSGDVARLLAGAGLTEVEAAPCPPDEAACDDFVASLAPGLAALGIDADAFRRRAAPLRHVWRARLRPAAERLTLVSTMLSPVGGVSDVRVVEPMQALAADPGLTTRIIANSDAPPDDVTGPRIMILHRPLLAGASGLARIRALLAGGWVVVCEFDDHPDYIPVLQRPDIQNFRAVHAVQTSTEPLANVLRQQNSEVAIFENAIARLPDVANFASEDRITLLFAGLNRGDEWPPYIDALNAVAARFGRRLHFEIISDRALFEALRTEHKHFTPLCDYEVYREMLSRSEVSLMPLSDTPFNRCKSDLKYIEAAAHRVVACASSIVYRDSIEDGRTGMLFGTPAELEQRLSLLVANPAMARAVGDAGRCYVQDKRMLAYQLARRVAWYRSLWARREELTRILFARVPELAE